MTKIRLTIPEVLVAAAVGCARQLLAMYYNYKDKHGAEGPGWNKHIEGACGECAFAKFLNVFWSPTINTFKHGHDVAGYQVRTRSREDWDLIIREDDKPAPFVLVVGRCPEFEIIGGISWSINSRLQHNDWICTHGGREAAWFVPQSELVPIARFVEEVAKEMI